MAKIRQGISKSPSILMARGNCSFAWSANISNSSVSCIIPKRDGNPPIDNYTSEGKAGGGTSFALGSELSPIIGNSSNSHYNGIRQKITITHLGFTSYIGAGSTYYAVEPGDVGTDASLYIGFEETVTTSTGLRIYPGETVTLDCQDAIFGISSSGSIGISVIEEFYCSGPVKINQNGWSYLQWFFGVPSPDQIVEAKNIMTSDPAASPQYEWASTDYTYPNTPTSEIKSSINCYGAYGYTISNDPASAKSLGTYIDPYYIAGFGEWGDVSSKSIPTVLNITIYNQSPIHSVAVVPSLPTLMLNSMTVSGVTSLGPFTAGRDVLVQYGKNLGVGPETLGPASPLPSIGLDADASGNATQLTPDGQTSWSMTQYPYRLLPKSSLTYSVNMRCRSSTESATNTDTQGGLWLKPWNNSDTLGEIKEFGVNISVEATVA